MLASRCPVARLIGAPAPAVSSRAGGRQNNDLTAERSHITGNTRLRFYMSSVNKDLIYHLYSIFNPYVKTGPKFIHRKLNKLTNLEHIEICVALRCFVAFFVLRVLCAQSIRRADTAK